MDTFGDIFILRTDESITEEPRVLLKTLVIYLETETPKIFDKEHCGCAGVTLSKSVNLPDALDEPHDMPDSLDRRNRAIIKLLLLSEVIVKKFR